MADDNNTKGIPAWQRAGNTEPQDKPQKPDLCDKPSDTPKEPPSKTDEPAPTQDESLLAKARAFLQDDSLRDSSLADKVEFLQSKGVTRETIDQAVASIPSTATMSSSTSISPPTSTISPSVQPRDAPPIITYPEFLIHSNKPPPLITARRLINTAYVAAGASALIYGASKYLITPMADSLSAARHDFAHHTQEQLDKLNAALEGVVSTDPALLTSTTLRQHDTHMRGQAGHEHYAHDGDEASSDSDPTELFHRDFGTQTADLPAPGATVSDTTSEDSRADETAVDAQTRQLRHLRTLCKDIAAEESNEADTAHEISVAVKVLEEQLTKISMPKHNSSAYGVFDHGMSTGDAAKKQDDEMAKMKAEIRSVKGVLLSAKNFPGSNSGARRVNAPA